MINGQSIQRYLVGLLFASSSLFAHPALISQLQPIFTFTTGESFSQLGQSQSFTPLDLCTYSYQPHNSTNTNRLLGGFVGVGVQRWSSWTLIAGLGYYQPSVLSTKGYVIQGVDPESNDTYRYQYQSRSHQWLAESKLYWIAKEKVQPFLMVGMGAAFNKTSNYQTNAPSFFAFTPAFSNHTQTQFTYAIGPGIDISLTQSLRIGLAYRFTDLGSIKTGSAQIDQIPITTTLKQSHLYANQILAQLTFIPWN